MSRTDSIPYLSRSPRAVQHEVVHRRRGVPVFLNFTGVPVLQRTASHCAAPGTRGQQLAIYFRPDSEGDVGG